jgi:hypothetical protein
MTSWKADHSANSARNSLSQPSEPRHRVVGDGLDLPPVLEDRVDFDIRGVRAFSGAGRTRQQQIDDGLRPHLPAVEEEARGSGLPQQFDCARPPRHRRQFAGYLWVLDAEFHEARSISGPRLNR